MNKLEIASVIIGFVCMIMSVDHTFEGNIKGLIVSNIFHIIKILIYLSMILIPMYFRFWR